MTRRETLRKLLPALLLLVGIGPASAVDFHFDGYADLRLILPSGERSWVDGGLGKTRFGNEYSSPDVTGELTGQGTIQLLPSLMVTAVGRIEPTQKTAFDVIEGYIRYRPVSTSAFRWSVKAGAFFPPISLENTEVGWTSPWTLTPSAINSWVGEELRTIGAEGDVSWRTDERTVSIDAAIFGWNDPAGILLADRGWAMDDRPTGLFDNLKVPDANPIARHQPVPMRTMMFMDIDSRAGFYAGATWDETGIGKIQFMRYDNQANPEKITTQVAWDTDFWSLGAQTQIGDFTFMAQGMTGKTYIEPSEHFESETYFKAAYFLAGWSMNEDWRLAARYDVFSTDEGHTGGINPLSEHGNAVTFAVNYLPNNWLRFTGELLHVNSTRGQRGVVGESPNQSETQFQLSARAYIP
jgi:hypothetical protein